jgi:tartrate dehydratase beta subunit/fumarate hydratase class I family protein
MKHKNAVLRGLENMRKYDGIGDGVVYSVDGTTYTTDQMIEEIKSETEVGKKFSQSVYDTIISYMGKFTQKTE